MKIVLAGAFGRLGADVLKCLTAAGHAVIAADITAREMKTCTGFVPVQVDLTDRNAVRGLCDGADAVISTVGSTTSYDKPARGDINYEANKNLIDEAVRANVRNFAYVSILNADRPRGVPAVAAKGKLEAYLKKSGLSWVIFRPAPYFYNYTDIFLPMVEKGRVTLPGRKAGHCNAIDTPEFAAFITEHMLDNSHTYNVGGKEIRSSEDFAEMCFAAAGKKPRISYAPAFLYSVKESGDGRSADTKFAKWLLTEELVAPIEVGEHTFENYVMNQFSGSAQR